MAFYELALRSCGRGLWRPVLKRYSDFGGEDKIYIRVSKYWGIHRNISIRGAKKQSENLYVVDKNNGNKQHSIILYLNVYGKKNTFYYDLT